GQRKLNQNPVDLISRVQVTNQREQLIGGGRLVQHDLLRVEAELLARLDLAADVNLGGGIAADQYCRQPGSEAALCKMRGFGGDFVFDGPGDAGAVEYFSGHRLPSSQWVIKL